MAVESDKRCENCLYDQKGCCGFNTKEEYCVLYDKWEPKPTCNMAAECEAYQNGCNGTIEPCSFGGPYKWSAMNEPQPREVVVKGFMDDGYCPNCNGCLEDLVKECRYCGQLVSWEHWKAINDYTEEAND